MYAINIAWDVDDPEDLDDLPETIEIPAQILADIEDEDEAEEIISDYITDVTGFCHLGFEIVED